METKLFLSNNPKIRSTIPKAPPVPEQPLDKLPPSNVVCEICGKVFKTHSQLDRHMENEHGNPEKTHTQPHFG